MDKKKKKNGKLPIIIAIVVGIIALVAAFMAIRVVGVQNNLEKGDAYLKEEKYNEAIGSYNSVLKIMPTSADAYLGLMQAYLGLEEYEKAMEIVQEGIDKTGSENLAKSKDIVFDQVFATYVLNHYYINILKGESEQLTVTNRSRDMGFEVSFLSADESIATIDSDGKILALEDGDTTLSANVGNEIWGYRNIDCHLTVGVVVTFLEEAGCDYAPIGEAVYAPAYVYQTNEGGELITDGNLLVNQTDAIYTVDDVAVTDPDVDGNVTYTINATVIVPKEFGIIEGTPEFDHEWYYDCRSRDMFLCDEYTGLVIAEQDLYGYDEPVIDSTVVYNNVEYHVSGSIQKEVENNEDWEATLDSANYTTWAKAPVIKSFTYTITAPKEYQGLVFAVDKKGIKKYISEEELMTEANKGFFEPLKDGSVREADDFYIIRITDYLE